jgi:hypothetical protein
MGNKKYSIGYGRGLTVTRTQCSTRWEIMRRCIYMAFNIKELFAHLGWWLNSNVMVALQGG